MPTWPEGVVVPPRVEAVEPPPDPLKLIRKRPPKKSNRAKSLSNNSSRIKRSAAEIAAARRARDNPDTTLPQTDGDEAIRRPRNQNLRIFSPTPAQRVMVSALTACNVSTDGIAAYIRTNEDTLRRYFRYELAEGYNRTEASLVGVLVVKALGGNMTALTMMLKCVFGWRENGKVGDGQATIEALTTEQRVSLIEGLRASLDTEEAGSPTRRKNKARVVTVAGTADENDPE